MPQGPKTGRILGLDYGSVRIGVAVSDELQMLARPVTTIQCPSRRETLNSIVRLVHDFGPKAIVIGLPKNMDGTLGAAAAQVQSFVHELEKIVALPIRMVDERLSTRESEELILTKKRNHRWQSRGCSSGQDAYAAAVILQRYLNGEC